MSSLLDFYKTELAERPLMPALLAQGNLEVPPSRYIRCPLYTDNSPSVYVYNDHLTDYGDGNKRYDLLAVAREWLGLAFEEAIGLLARLANVTAPVEFKGEVKPVKVRPIVEAPKRDPHEFADLARQAERALWAQESEKAVDALTWIGERGLIDAAAPFRLGVIDHTTRADLPNPIWGGFLTLPAWHGDRLTFLAGRNLLPKPDRVMRNLGGAGTAVYGLDLALQTDGPVIVVEGQTDCMSTWLAFEGAVGVVGIPGATHWKRLQHDALAGRPLYIALDTDEAGRKALGECQRWAADAGRPVTLLNVADERDKNDVLMQDGPATLRELLRDAVRSARRKAARRLQ